MNEHKCEYNDIKIDMCNLKRNFEKEFRELKQKYYPFYTGKHATATTDGFDTELTISEADEK